MCALTDPAASIPYDQAEVQQARRDALGWWIPLLGDAFVCLATLALDEARCGGAITVTRESLGAEDGPFARLFPATTVRTDDCCPVQGSAGPVLERYAGVAWPGGRFADPLRRSRA